MSFPPTMMPTKMPSAMMPSMDMSMSMGEMSMVMTFSDFNVYKTKILFEDWNCKNQWQFGLSCLCIIACTIFYQWLKIYMMRLEKRMKNHVDDSNYFASDIPNSSNLYVGNKSNAIESSKVIVFDFQSRLLHAFVAAIMYGFALMLMLVAMTFNPNLFISLMIGYGIGDLLFYPSMVNK